MAAKVLTETRKKGKPEEERKPWELRLYVIGQALKSIAALRNLKKICHEHLENKCRIAVIDIEKSPRLAKEKQIVAVPTLIKTYPLPMRRVIGDLSNTGRVLAGLDIDPLIKNDTRITHQLHRRP
jgi:circadian clock protein KaiB